MPYVYRKTDTDCWTVGFYDPSGKWEPESDHMRSEDAALRTMLLNGTPGGTRDIQDFFELSYAQYLTIPRTALQSMPIEWQRVFVGLLDQLDKAIEWRPEHMTCYFVSLHQMIDDMDEFNGLKRGPAIKDTLADYQRGRRKVTGR